MTLPQAKKRPYYVVLIVLLMLTYATIQIAFD